MQPQFQRISTLGQNINQNRSQDSGYIKQFELFHCWLIIFLLHTNMFCSTNHNFRGSIQTKITSCDKTIVYYSESTVYNCVIYKI